MTLYRWQELKCRKVKIVDEAIVVVESLMEFQRSMESQARTFKPTKGNFGKGGGDVVLGTPSLVSFYALPELYPKPSK